MCLSEFNLDLAIRFMLVVFANVITWNLRAIIREERNHKAANVDPWQPNKAEEIQILKQAD